MEGLLKQSTAVDVTVLMIDSNDHITGKTGLAAGLTIYATKAAGTPATMTPTVTELDATNVKGLYKLALTTTHTNTLGELQLHVTATGADPTDVKWQVVTLLPGEAVTLQADQAVNTTKIGGTTQTARDLGASVLLSAGTGTGQLDFTSGVVKSNLVQILATALTETAGQIAAGFKKLFDVASPVLTLLSVNQTGDAYARLGAPAGASTAADIAAVKSDTGTLTTRLTSARAGYLDNLNVGGAVASQADINALNQSASRRVILTTVPQYERPESGSSSYTIEARTYDGDGAPVDADSTPTLTATGIVSGDLSANLSAASHPATGVYRWAYTVANNATQEQVRFDVSATLSSTAFPLSVYAQVVDMVAATWTSTDASHLTAVFNKLPSKTYLAGSNNSDGDVQMDEATGNFPGSVASVVARVTANTDQIEGVDATNQIRDSILSDATRFAGANIDGTITSRATPTQVKTQVDQALVDLNLDHLIKLAVDTDFPTTVHLNSVVGHLADNGTSATFDRATDSLEAIRDRGDAAWTTGGSGLTQADVRTAVGLASANLDTQLGAIAGYIDTEVAAIKAKTDNLPSDPADASDIAASFSTVNGTLSTIAGYIDTEVAAIKAKTDNLPSDPADASNIAAAFGTVNTTLATIAGYIDTEVSAIKAKTDNLPADPADASDIAAAFSTVNASLATILASIGGGLQAETAYAGDNALPFHLVQATDHDMDATGISAVAEFSLDGGATFAAFAGSVAETSGGWYHVPIAADEIPSGTAFLVFRGSGAGAATVQFTIPVSG